MTESLLNGRLALFDVVDVEGLCRKVIDVQLRKTHAHLRPNDFDDCVAFLIQAAYELSLRYDPSRDLAFSTYCWRILRLRIVDFYRARFSDRRFGGEDKANVDFALSLDARIFRDDDDDPPASTLGELIAARPDDSSGDCGADFAGIHGGGGGGDAWRAELRREKMAFRASERNRGRRRDVAG